MLPLVLLLATGVSAHYVVNGAGQVVLDNVAHPEWADRQAALGWTAPDKGDTVLAGGGVGSCGGLCVLTPEEMEGPFYLDKNLARSNITEAVPGFPLALTISLYQVESNASSHAPHSTCEPLAGAWVDIWSCDAAGIYSGYGNGSMGPPPGGPGGPDHPRGPPGRGPGDRKRPGPPGGPGGPGGHAQPTTNATFLRGVQQTGADGLVTFDTVWPGWYPGRTVHVHLKVHPPSWSDPSTHNATHTHTTQLFFPDTANDYISKQSPYAQNIVKRVRNEEDGLYRDMAGASLASVEWVGGAGPSEAGLGVGWTGSSYGQAGAKAFLAVGVDKWW